MVGEEWTKQQEFFKNLRNFNDRRLELDRAQREGRTPSSEELGKTLALGQRINVPKVQLDAIRERASHPRIHQVA